MTYAQFIEKNRVTMTSKLVDRNPNLQTPWGGAVHWEVTLRCNRRQMTTFLSQGALVCRDPTAEDVLSCMALDAGVMGYATFDAWADDMGLDPDSKKAERLYESVKEQTWRLQDWLRPMLFRALLTCHE